MSPHEMKRRADLLAKRRRVLSVLSRYHLERLSTRKNPEISSRESLIQEISNMWVAEEVVAAVKQYIRSLE